MHVIKEERDIPMGIKILIKGGSVYVLHTMSKKFNIARSLAFRERGYKRWRENVQPFKNCELIQILEFQLKKK